MTFRSINRWTLCHMVISTAREKTPMKITEYGTSLSICCYIWTRPNNYGTVWDIRCNKTIINLVRVLYDGLSPLESWCHLGASPLVTPSLSGRQCVISHSYKVDNCIMTTTILISSVMAKYEHTTAFLISTATKRFSPIKIKIFIIKKALHSVTYQQTVNIIPKIP